MDREAIEDMLETMSIGDSDQGKLRQLLIEHEQEMQRLRNENERLKILADSGKKCVDEKSGRVIDMTRPQPCVRWLDARAQDKEERLVFCLKKLAEEYEEVWEAYGEYVSHNSGVRFS